MGQESSHAPQYASIPVPSSDPEMLYHSVMALKDNVEKLVGTRGSSPAARVFYQNTMPKALAVGDLWITSDPRMTLSVWTGALWQPFVPNLVGFLALAVNGQAIPNAWVKMDLQSPLALVRDYDAATQRYTPGKGMSQFNISLLTTSNNNNADVRVAIYKNGAQIALSSGSANLDVEASATLSLAASTEDGDYFEAYMWADRTGMVIQAEGSHFSAFGVIGRGAVV